MGAPGVIDTRPRFSVGAAGVGRAGMQYHHDHHGRHYEWHHRETSQPDVTPRATVIGLPSSVNHSPLSIWNSNSSTRAGAYHHTLLTALESVTEPLINVDGHAIGSPSSRNGTGGGSAEGRTSTAVGVHYLQVRLLRVHYIIK